MVLRPKTDVVLEEFLPFFMQSDIFMDRAVKISVGGLSPTINWRDLAKEEFALPPLEEQRRIAEVLKGTRASSESYRRLSDSVAQTRLALVFEFESQIPDDGMTNLGEVTHGLQAGKTDIAIVRGVAATLSKLVQHGLLYQTSNAGLTAYVVIR